VQRRNVITTIGGIATGGVAVTLATTDQATAQVQYGSLDIPDRDYIQTSELQDVRLTVTANWSFDAAQVPDRWVCELQVGTENETIAADRMAPSSQSDSGSVELTGSVVDTSQFNIEQFRVDSGGSETTVQIPTRLVYRIETGETQIAQATAEATPSVTVTPGEVEGSAEVGGNGEIVLSR